MEIHKVFQGHHMNRFTSLYMVYTYIHTHLYMKTDISVSQRLSESSIREVLSAVLQVLEEPLECSIKEELLLDR